ncbi:MAG: RagB/SusD family nutrient uptake outer membrane protein [Staphylococcus sp.]|nr:RagB/SusD family nutrient uptake outer membrane protein [Staphylococcus sp.]
MKKQIIYTFLAAAMAPCLTSCLEEFTPTNIATENQVQNAEKISLSNAISAYMNTATSTANGGTTYDAGFMSFAITRDVMTADLPIYEQAYDYFSVFGYNTYLGDYTFEHLHWQRYFGLVQKCNLLLGVANPDNADDRVYMGNALTYRAMAYLDMARLYEYRHTDVGYLDQRGEAIKGLTVPIVTEKTTDSEGRNNPRAPFSTMYRFILTDLNNAEEYLSDTHAADSKINACLGVVYGMKARLYLELGTRFTLHAEDLDKLTAGDADESAADFDRFGINNAAGFYAKAAEYARKAIAEGFTPTSQAEWFDTKNGFNTPISSWLWCITISPEDPIATSFVWQSFVSFMSPEANWGLASPTYNASRMIDARLFGTIPDNDWRKTTWIAPDDVADLTAYNQKYAKGTSMSYKEWSNLGAYVGTKFHPAGGDRNSSTTGNAVSFPLMRIEEMYFIEAEATARVSGVAAGAQLLESFMNTYRYTNGSYTCKATGIDDFTDEVFKQKRIEFWGEGQILWDYRRLEKAVTRGYPGTNHYSQYLFNSYPNAVAPWTTLYIPDSESNYNVGLVLNPDPSNAIPLWSEEN